MLIFLDYQDIIIENKFVKKIRTVIYYSIHF